MTLRPLFLLLLPLAAPLAATPLYRATLQTPAEQTLVVRDMRWVCVGTACAAPRVADTSDLKVCAAVARKLGPMTRFEADSRVFDAAELARCNEAAAR